MVNTFLPYGDYKKIAKVLDNKRLGKQRVEAYQIINILDNKNPNSKGWRHHPIVLQWKGYSTALKLYFNTMVDEWIKRGYTNTMVKYEIKDPAKVQIPWFVTCKVLNLSHQASLLRKEPAYYKKYFKSVPCEYLLRSYVWIPQLNEEQIAILKKAGTSAKGIDIDLFTKATPEAIRIKLLQESAKK